MTVSPIMAQKPQRDLPEGYYAIRLSGGQTEVYQRVSDPFAGDSDESEWTRVRSDSSIPWSKVDRMAGEFDSDNDPWIYLKGVERRAEELEPLTEQTELSDMSDYRLVIRAPTGSYEIESDTQSEGFAEVFEVLIQQFGLVEAVGGTPFVPGRNRAVFNDEPVHLDGSEMDRPHPIAGNNYHVETQPTKHMKVSRLEGAVEYLDDVEIEFTHGWKD